MRKFLYTAVIVLTGVMGSAMASRNVEPIAQDLATKALQMFVNSKEGCYLATFNEVACHRDLNLKDREIRDSISSAAWILLEVIDNADKYSMEDVANFPTYRAWFKHTILFFAKTQPDLTQSSVTKLIGLCELYRLCELQQLTWRNILFYKPSAVQLTEAIDDIAHNYQMKLPSRLAKEYIELGPCERMSKQFRLHYNDMCVVAREYPGCIMLLKSLAGLSTVLGVASLIL